MRARKKNQKTSEKWIEIQRQCKKKVFIDRYYRALTGQELRSYMVVRVRMCMASALLHACIWDMDIYILCCKQKQQQQQQQLVHQVLSHHSYTTTDGLV